MPTTNLDLADTTELAELLQFIRDWLTTDYNNLDTSLTASIYLLPAATTSTSYAPTWTASPFCSPGPRGGPRPHPPQPPQEPGSISLTVFPAVFISRFRRPGIGRRR